MRSLAALVQRLMLRTNGGRLRPLWSLVYRTAVRSLAAVLGRATRRASVYACGSFGYGEPVYGVSDIDLVVVAPESGEGPGAARAQVVRRWTRLASSVPLLGDIADVAVYETPALAELAADSTITFGLTGADAGRPSASVYFGAQHSAASPALRERSGLFGPMRGWRLVRGEEQRPPARDHDRDQRRIAAWLALQSWWRWTFQTCAEPGRPWVAEHSRKLVSEPVRILLWVRHGERVFGRTELRRRVRALMPEHAETLDRWAGPDANAAGTGTRLAEALPHLVALSGEIARWLADDVGAATATAVELLGAGEEPALSRASQHARSALPPRWGQSTLLPLADWRARVYPWFVDEAFSPAPGDPADLGDLAEAARAGREGPYVALAADGLLVLPTEELSIGRGRLRGVQCPVTDPVSFALLAGATVASFPDVPGWSVRDSARRAVAEHAACLARPRADEEPDALAKGLNAARAGLLQESLEEGSPQLSLTVAATLRRLAARGADAESVADEAWGAYTAWRREGLVPPQSTAARLHRAVGAMRPYRVPPADSDARTALSSASARH